MPTLREKIIPRRKLMLIASEAVIFTGVLFVGTDLAELLDVCDRVLVLYAGRIAGEVTPGEIDEEALGLMMTGGRA